MNVGKTLFAQIMEFVPWKTFGRIIERHKGDAGVRTFGCADLFRVMAFAQLTWRESLRDVEACLAANQAKLFHMGLKTPGDHLVHGLAASLKALSVQALDLERSKQRLAAGVVPAVSLAAHRAGDAVLSQHSPELAAGVLAASVTVEDQPATLVRMRWISSSVRGPSHSVASSDARWRKPSAM